MHPMQDKQQRLTFWPFYVLFLPSLHLQRTSFITATITNNNNNNNIIITMIMMIIMIILAYTYEP